MKGNKKTIVLSILAVLVLIAAVAGFTYAYFSINIKTDSELNVVTETSNGSIVEYTKGENVELLHAEPGDYKETIFEVSLKAPNDSSDTIIYKFVWDISENEFVYEPEHPTDAQLVYSLYSSSDKINWVPYKENVDCTSFDSQAVIAGNNILTTSAGTTTTVYWKFVLEYKAYDYNQASNMEKYFTGKLSIAGIE